MTPQDEAAAIFIRLMEAICRLNRKTLNERSRADIARACELLSHAGEQFDDLLSDLPEPPPRSEYTTVNFAVPPEVRQRQRQRGER